MIIFRIFCGHNQSNHHNSSRILMRSIHHSLALTWMVTKTCCSDFSMNAKQKNLISRCSKIYYNKVHVLRLKKARKVKKRGDAIRLNHLFLFPLKMEWIQNILFLGHFRMLILNLWLATNCLVFISFQIQGLEPIGNTRGCLKFRCKLSFRFLFLIMKIWWKHLLKSNAAETFPTLA